MSQLSVENKPSVVREQLIRPTNLVSQPPPRIEPKQAHSDSEINNIFDEFGCPNMYVLADIFNSSTAAD